jgi:hypothetical protein
MTYPGATNTAVQCFSALTDNRFTISLPSTNQGSTSQLIFNPAQGLSDIVVTATLPPQSGTLYVGYAFPQGWLAGMVNTVALRIGGSSLYYWTGAQILVDTLQECENGNKQQAVFNLAGSALGTVTTAVAPVASVTAFPSDATSPLLSASFFLKMPFNTISSMMKTLALPTDLLTQPVQILITWKNFSDIAFKFQATTLASSQSLPTAFANCSARFRQTTLVNSEHLLARREDMNSKMLVYPLRSFCQTEFTTVATSVAGTPFPINATGLRSGSIKWIDVYVTSPAVTGAGNNWNFVPISQLQFLVNGLIYYDSASSDSQMWNLCDSPVALTVNTTGYTSSASPISNITTLTATTSAMPWYRIQLGQRPVALAYENEMSLGLNIANSVCNLNLTVPVSEAVTVRLVYHYACNLIFTKGTAEYLFT